MPAKEKVTRKEIEQDAREYLKWCPNETRASYEKGEAIGIIINGILFVPFIVLMICLPTYTLLFLIAALVCFMVFASIIFMAQRRKAQALSLENYDITTAVLSSVALEEYTKRSVTRQYGMSREVKNYALHFEGGKSWRIPERCYRWRKEGRLSDLYIYENSHRGDVFTVVTHKKTGQCVAVYSHKLFDCKSIEHTNGKEQP